VTRGGHPQPHPQPKTRPSTPTPTPQSLATILRRPGVKKKPFLIRSVDDCLLASRLMAGEALAPIFLTSSVTGQGLDLVGGGGWGGVLGC